MRSSVTSRSTKSVSFIGISLQYSETWRWVNRENSMLVLYIDITIFFLRKIGTVFPDI